MPGITRSAGLVFFTGGFHVFFHIELGHRWHRRRLDRLQLRLGRRFQSGYRDVEFFRLRRRQRLGGDIGDIGDGHQVHRHDIAVFRHVEIALKGEKRGGHHSCVKRNGNQYSIARSARRGRVGAPIGGGRRRPSARRAA